MKRIPLLNDTLISADGRFTLTLIDLDPTQRKIRLAADRVRAIKRTIADLEIPAGYSTFVSGLPAILHSTGFGRPDGSSAQ